jgi:hypothetical protein
MTKDLEQIGKLHAFHFDISCIPNNVHIGAYVCSELQYEIWNLHTMRSCVFVRV